MPVTCAGLVSDMTIQRLDPSASWWQQVVLIRTSMFPNGCCQPTRPSISYYFCWRNDNKFQFIASFLLKFEQLGGYNGRDLEFLGYQNWKIKIIQLGHPLKLCIKTLLRSRTRVYNSSGRVLIGTYLRLTLY